MKISDIVRHKGDSVVTVRSDATVKDLLALLAEHKIGAIVVSDSDGSVDGIVSERDVVRHLHSGGAQVLDGTVGRIMTRDVHTCTTDDDLTDLAGQMTERRIRRPRRQRRQARRHREHRRRRQVAHRHPAGRGRPAPGLHPGVSLAGEPGAAAYR